MAREAGREREKRRRETVEPRIGLIQHGLGVRRFLRRGRKAVTTEWSWIGTAVNLGMVIRQGEQVKAAW